MFKIVKCEGEILAAVTGMFDELGEPQQVLTIDSPRPLIVHRVMGQMTLVAGGTGWAQLAGRMIPLSTGDLLILTPGCEHSFAAEGDGLHLRHWHWPQAMLHQDRVILQERVDFDALAAQLDGGRP